MPIEETLVVSPQRDERWKLARQLGVAHAATRLPHAGAWRGTETAESTDETRPWEFEPLLHIEQRFANAGFDIVALEDIYPPLEAVRTGRDCKCGVSMMTRFIEHLGVINLPVLCYNWSAAFNWVRTSTTTPLRGGSLTSAHDHDRMAGAPAVDADVTEAELWANLEYFPQDLVPVASPPA